jgi:hypothetical protein
MKYVRNSCSTLHNNNHRILKEWVLHFVLQLISHPDVTVADEFSISSYSWSPTRMSQLQMNSPFRPTVEVPPGCHSCKWILHFVLQLKSHPDVTVADAVYWNGKVLSYQNIKFQKRRIQYEFWVSRSGDNEGQGLLTPCWLVSSNFSKESSVFETSTTM